MHRLGIATYNVDCRLGFGSELQFMMWVAVQFEVVGCRI